MAFGNKFKGTVTLRKSIRGPVLVAWREEGKRSVTYSQNKFMPHNLAMYLGLMPTNGSGIYFTNRLYQFSNKELEALTPDSYTPRITRRRGDYILTLDLTGL
jgi:hypothetical protein